MAASISGSRRYDVFPSFSGEDVRRGFLSYILKEFDRRSINSFIDNGIERSRPIGPELLSAIREARISIVIFSKNYASSTWCLNELVEIYNCYNELDQMVIPIFYNVDPLEVRKQNGEFGESFMKTCEGKTDDEIQRWKQALTDVANLAGEHLQNWPSEADMVEKIANDVSNKLLSPSNGFGDLVGIKAHIEAMKSILCLESEESRMIGIWGQSGIGKSTLGRALFSHLSPKFPLRNFSTHKDTDQDVSGMKLSWEQSFLSEILGQKDIKIENCGVVKERLKYKKVLVVLDDVVNPLFLETLVGKTEWFGPGSRIIVITQDRHLLKAHDIDLLYEVKIPDHDIALKMLCQSAFGQNSPPEGLKELAVQVARLAGYLPLGLRVLGSSLKGRTKEEWKELLPDLQNSLKGDIMKTLRVGYYDRLDEKEQDIFLCIASLLSGKSVQCINDLLGNDNRVLKRLAEKSLIRITPTEIVEMHNLLKKLGREIDRAESKGNLGKRRYLTNHDEILDVFADQSGTETVLGIIFNAPLSSQPFTFNEKSFKGMSNLQFLQIHNHYSNRLRLPNGLSYFPRKIKYLHWDYCPLKCLPSNFKSEFLVELRMENSELEKLWEGTQQFGSLKTIIMSGSIYLKEISDLSKAINLERVDFSGCYNLESFPSPFNSKSLEYLNLLGCPLLQNFPQITVESLLHGIEIRVYDCVWNKNLPELNYLDCLRRCYPIKFLPEHLHFLEVKGNMLEKLWGGVQSLGNLWRIDFSESENLKEIPDLSKATNLRYLNLSNCKSLVTLPFTIGNLQKLWKLEMKECTGLKVLPVNVNLSSLKTLNLNGCSSLTSFPQLSRRIENLYLDHTAIEEVPCCIEMFPILIELSMCGCSSLTSFPQISRSIERLYLDDTAIEEVPCFIEMLPRLTKLSMRRCNRLKNISPNIFRLTNLKQVNFTGCEDFITAWSDTTVVATIKDPYENIEMASKVGKRHRNDPWYFNFHNCSLDRRARELIIQSSFMWTMILPGEEVPKYFNHRAYGNFLTVTLPQGSLSHKFLRFNVCVVVKPLTKRYMHMNLHFRFNGVFYKHAIDVDMPMVLWKTDHLVLFSFKFRPTGLPSKMGFNDVGFKFEGLMRIREVGIRVLNVSTSGSDRDGRSSQAGYNQQLGQKCDVVEIERSNKKMQVKMQITSGKSEECFSLPCSQIVTDTGLITPTLEVSLERGESSAVSSYPCLEGGPLYIDTMITEQQGAHIPIVDPGPEPDIFWQSTWSTSSESSASSPRVSTSSANTSRSASTSIFSCWGRLLKRKKKESVEVYNSGA